MGAYENQKRNPFAKAKSERSLDELTLYLLRKSTSCVIRFRAGEQSRFIRVNGTKCFNLFRFKLEALDEANDTDNYSIAEETR